MRVKYVHAGLVWSSNNSAAVPVSVVFSLNSSFHVLQAVQELIHDNNQPCMFSYKSSMCKARAGTAWLTVCVCCLQAPDYSASELMPLRDSMMSTADDYNMIDGMMPSGGSHMGHRHMDPGHNCLYRQTYRWLCHHREVIRMALVMELVLCAMFAAAHLIWSCCLKAQSSDDAEADSDLKAPLIESASSYIPDDQKLTISPLWAHVMKSQSGTCQV